MAGSCFRRAGPTEERKRRFLLPLVRLLSLCCRIDVDARATLTTRRRRRQRVSPAEGRHQGDAGGKTTAATRFTWWREEDLATAGRRRLGGNEDAKRRVRNGKHWFETPATVSASQRPRGGGSKPAATRGRRQAGDSRRWPGFTSGDVTVMLNGDEKHERSLTISAKKTMSRR